MPNAMKLVAAQRILITDAIASGDIATAESLVIAATTVLTQLLARHEIGLEVFSAEIRRTLVVAGW